MGRSLSAMPPKRMEMGSALHVEAGEAKITRISRSEFGGGRRNDVTIGLWCELCGRKSSIEFRQHKGKTYVFVSVGDVVEEPNGLL